MGCPNQKNNELGINEEELDFVLWKKALIKELSIFWDSMTKVMEIDSDEERKFLEHLVKKYASIVLFGVKTNESSP